MEVSQRSSLLKKKVEKGEEELIDLPQHSTQIHPCARFVPLILILFLLVLIFGSLCGFLVYLFPASVLVTVDSLDVKKCPACAGQSICPVFYRKEVRISGHCGRKIDADTGYPVHGCDGSVGLYNNKRSVRIRRCASPANSHAVDEAVCRRGLRHGLATAPESVRKSFSCIPHLAIWRWRPTNDPRDGESGESVETPLHRGLVVAPLVSTNPNKSESSDLELPITFGPATRCCSDRLFNHLQTKFRERTSPGAETRWLRFDELMFLFNLAIDPHPLLIQTFPREQGWPFPKYVGSCGRWFIEENHGVPLSAFCLAPAWLRLRILANILTIPERLVRPIRLQNHSPHLSSHPDDSTDGYAIYLGDFDLPSLFYVDPNSYDVTISNLGHAIVVDIETLSEYGFGSNEEHSVPPSASEFMRQEFVKHKCLGNISHSGDAGGPTPPCMTREHADNLCSHLQSDHNYWAICSALVLSRDKSCDFLDQMPKEIVDLLDQCVKRSGSGVRQDLIQQALELIKSAINVNPKPSDP